MAAAVLAALLGTAAPTWAQTPRVQLNIASQPLASALLDFGVQTGIAIAFAEKQTEGVRAPAISGEYAPRQALELMLRDSGLTYEFVDAKTVRIGMRAKSVDREDASPPAASWIEEISVTAQKREESSLEIPLSLTAYSGDFLESIGARELEALSLFTPGLEVRLQSVTSPGVVIRGITSDGGGEQRVAIYVDGVSSSAVVGSDFEFYDLERVEVAKGPQSTLFGRGALIGGVNIVQNKAGPEQELRLSSGIGDYDYRFAEGVVNTPVADGLYLRIAARHRSRSGYVDDATGGDAYNPIDATAFRTSLRFEPTAALTFDFIYNHEENRADGGTAFKSNAFLPRDPRTGMVVGDTSASSPMVLGTFGAHEGQGLRIRRELDDQTLLASWAISEVWTLSSITGRREFDNIEVFDPDGSSMPLMDGIQQTFGDQFSQELRANFDSGGAFKGTLGTSYVDFESADHFDFQFDERGMSLLFDGTLRAASPLGLTTDEIIAATTGRGLKPSHLEDSLNGGRSKTLDVYADGTWQASQRLSLTTGLRWTQDEKTARLRSALPNGPSTLTGGGIFSQPTPEGRTLTAQDTFDGWSWRLASLYAFNDELNGYAAYSRGRRAENVAVNARGSVSTTPAEIVDSYEIGLKGQAMGGKLIADGSVYFYQYADFQTLQRVAGILTSVNAGEAEAYGVEIQGRAELSSRLSLLANYAYNHARLTTGAYDGNRFRNAPDHSFSLGLFFRQPVYSLGELYFTPTYSWQSRFFFNDNNDRPDLQRSDAGVDEFQDAYGLLNLILGFESRDRSKAVEVMVSNALDETYIVDAGNAGDSFGIPSFIAGPTRMLSLLLKFQF